MDDQNRRTTDDVRMRGFTRRQSVERATAWLDAQLQPLDPEPVPLRMAARRVLVESITSNVDVPGFDRATMDGYALAAESTEGARSGSPILMVPLSVVMRYEFSTREASSPEKIIRSRQLSSMLRT